MALIYYISLIILGLTNEINKFLIFYLNSFKFPSCHTKCRVRVTELVDKNDGIKLYPGSVEGVVCLPWPSQTVQFC